MIYFKSDTLNKIIRYDLKINSAVKVIENLR
jgi:hypothetical protein